MRPCSFLILFVLSFFHSICQAGEYHFKNYDNKQGLSHNTVFCALQDKRGFMWFGTTEGLNRFDGYTFKVYRHNPDIPNSLPGDRIVHIFEDSEERLWICTNKQTCYYDYREDAFFPLKFSENDENTYHFFAINEDLQKNLWFTTYDTIIRYSLTDKQTTVFPSNEYFSPIYSSMTKEGNVLFASRRNIHIFNPGNNQFVSFPVITDQEGASYVEITAVCQANLPFILVGTNKAGLKLYNQIARTTETLIPEIQVRSIFAVSNDEYWIASESGLFIYNTNSKSVVNLRKSLTNEYSISDNAVYSITRDKEGGMWLGSFFGGISYLPVEHSRFNLFIGGKTHPKMLGNAVREICPDQYGNLWLGTEDNGINQYNLSTGEITNYSSNNREHPLSASNIHGLMADADKLWIGTFNKGIEIMDIPSGKTIKRYTLENTNQSILSDFIICFHKTGKGEILVGTAGGMLLYDPQADRFSHWRDIRVFVRQIFEDKSGNIWLASGFGVYRYDTAQQKMTHFQSDPHNKNTLPSNDICSVFEDSKGQIWIGSDQGLSLYNQTDGTFRTFSVKDGLPSNIIYRILEDGEKNFWISTANGLVRFNPETHAVRVYSHTDGLCETQFNFSSSYKSHMGTMYMGTINGLVSFNPQQFKDDNFVPPVYITNINLPKNNKKDSISFIPKLSGEKETIKLPYDMSSFTLSYVALSYTSPEAIRYAYMLEGSDNDWVEMDHKRDVTFANLSPGQYIFKVKSTNSSGIWQDNEKRLLIEITPPFWATRWAYLAYFIIAVLLIWIFYSYKKFKLEEKNRISRAMFESTKEKELYDAKIQFFTFITHEIRTPLTLIKAPLEKIIRSADGNPSTKENLRIIERNTQRLLNLSNQLLDFRKTESKGFKLNFVKTDINLFLEDIARSFRPAIAKEGKELTFDLPETHLIASVDREAFSKIISNLLTNAFKYSDKHIRMNLAVSEKDNTFSIAVCNDGYIIPEEEKGKIFEPFYRLKETENTQGSGIGLSLSKTLTEFHNGTLFYSLTEDRLNRFTLVLPQEQEGSFDSMGTDVPPEQPIPSGTACTQSANRQTVLIVEDQQDMRQFIVGELLEKYNVLEAGNGKEAIELLGRQNVQVIVSDVMMPVMNGFEFCNKIKNDINYSHIPLIILTAQHNLQSRLEGLNKGADAYIEKPFSTDLLLAQIDNLLKSRELLTRSYLEKPLTPALSLSSSKVDDIFLEKLNNYLEEQLSNEQLNVEMIAEKMGMSTSSLYRKVKAISGLSPVDFIKITRLKRAVQIMKEGESRINEVAFQVGFSTASYFSTCFQKQYGITPSDFMKEENPRR